MTLEQKDRRQKLSRAISLKLLMVYRTLENLDSLLVDNRLHNDFTGDLLAGLAVVVEELANDFDSYEMTESA